MLHRFDRLAVHIGRMGDGPLFSKEVEVTTTTLAATSAADLSRAADARRRPPAPVQVLIARQEPLDMLFPLPDALDLLFPIHDDGMEMLSL